jgi:hypothetical protein
MPAPLLPRVRRAAPRSAWSSSRPSKDPVARDLIRFVPHWPRDRYLDLAPRYWLATRARLDAAQLERELGLDLPAADPAAQQPAAG